MNKIQIARKDRISADQDNFNQLQLLKKYYNMRRLTNIVFPKETEHGYHILGYFPNRTAKENITVRLILGDCRIRIALDELCVGIDDELLETLFYEKIEYNRKTGESDFGILSKPFWSVRKHK